MAVQDRDMWITIGVGAAVLLVIVPTLSTPLLTSFDPVLAQSMGVRVKVYHSPPYGALDLGFCHCYAECRNHSHRRHAHLQPAATAYLYTNSLWSMMLLRLENENAQRHRQLLCYGMNP